MSVHNQFIYHRFFKSKKTDYAHVTDIRNFTADEFNKNKLYKVKDASDHRYHRSQILEFGSKYDFKNSLKIFIKMY